ncbi:MAG: LuxR C-terminal-related transcriptional regulator [Paludibacter sp.]|nr:LuxR C-terminal-related transcriptional regulator [Paludibacter sp.]
MKSLEEWKEEWLAMFQLHSANPSQEELEAWEAEGVQFLKLYNNPEVSITIIEISGGKVELYIGVNTKWLAHEAIQQTEPQNFRYLSELTHKDDKIFSFETELMGYDILMSLSGKERKRFWMKYHRRLLAENGEYIYYVFSTSVYKLDGNNTPCLLKIETTRLPKGYQPAKTHYREFSHSLKKNKKEKPVIPKLSPREKEILELIHEGYSTKQIAVKIGRSEHTVKNIRKKILKKLGAKNTNLAYEVAKKHMMI